MVIFKIAPVFFLILIVRAEKKIELQDIEEDNLKSEKQKKYETSDPQQHAEQASNFLTNSNFFRYFDSLAQSAPHQSPQQASHQSSHQAPPQARYHHQYAVTEVPTERLAPVEPQVQYSHPTPQPQQAMVGYLSNVPMQIYLVPQYYNEVDHKASPQAQYTTGVQYQAAPQQAHAVARVPEYSTAPEAVQSQTNYIEVPSYVAPTAKTYVQPYQAAHQVAYVTYSQPSVAVAPTAAPVIEYQVPAVQYSTAVVASQPAPKPYYQSTHYQDTNAVEEECKDDCLKQYTQPEVSYSKAPSRDYHRYTGRIPPREEYRPVHNQIQELPRPSPLLLKGLPSHIAHIPKAFPMYRPVNKPVYGGPPAPGILAGRPQTEHHGSFKRRPTSLLDSYVPSSVQIEYMKRGFTNDPLLAYEALSSGNHFSHAHAPKHFERGFLPNQMYHTAVGGVTFGHYKRTPKVQPNL